MIGLIDSVCVIWCLLIRLSISGMLICGIRIIGMLRSVVGISVYSWLVLCISGSD